MPAPIQHRHKGLRLKGLRPLGLRRRRRTITSTAVGIVVAGLLVGVSVGCASGSARQASKASTKLVSPRVVASTNVYADLAKSLMGGHGEVTAIIDSPNADPHEYETSTRDLLAVSRADILIVNGGGYDDFMDTLRSTAHNDDATLLNAVDISGHRDTAGHTETAGHQLNEHVWYDFPTVIRVVQRLADALVKIDPINTAGYRTNEQTLIERIKELQAEAAQISATHRGTPVAITEPVPLYLLQACGLVNRTPEAFSEAVEEGEDAAPSVLVAMFELLDNRRVAVLVVNAQTSDDQTDRVVARARAHRVPVVAVTETLPSGATYVTWMQANLDALASALGGHSPKAAR